MLSIATKKNVVSLWLLIIRRNRVIGHFGIKKEARGRNRVVDYSAIEPNIKGANKDSSDVNFSIKE